MFSVLGAVVDFLKLIFSFGGWLILAAVLVTIGTILSRAYLAALATGVTLMFVVLAWGWLSDDSKKVEQLERELKAKTAQLEIERATNKELGKHLAEEAAIAEHNAVVVSNLQKIIDALGDKPECGVSKDFTDALKDIR